jgi:fimbrial chaperone protein
MVPSAARWIALCLCLLAAGAEAGSLRVSPVRLTLSAVQSPIAFTVTNPTEQPVVVQLQVMAWAQHHGTDVYTPTQDLLVTPPIFRLEPGMTQTVRAGLRRPPSGPQEQAYRVYVQEVPAPARPGAEGLRVALRLGIPVFVTPTAPVAPVLHWRAHATPDGALTIRLHNAGTRHAQVQALQLRASAPPEWAVTLPEPAYILPGQARHWRVEPHALPNRAGGRLQVSAKTDQGEVHANIDVDQP